MTDMEQKVAKDAVAIQSGRDTNLGLTAEQVMNAIAQAIPMFGSIAKEVVDARHHDFKEEIFKKIADHEARIEAFADPAFISSLHVAQTSYAKTDDATVGDTLIDLVARRSNENKRGRHSLTLDQCISIAGELTIEEFAELSLVFLFRHTTRHGIADKRDLSAFLNSIIDPFINDISPEESAYGYLEAHRCATVSMGEAGWHRLLLGSYSSLLTKGFEKSIVDNQLKDVPSYLISPCLNDSSRFQLEGQNAKAFTDAAESASVSQSIIANALQISEAAFMNETEVLAFLAPHVPNFAKFAKLWSDTPLKNLQLTSAGKAIGYSNAVRKAGFSADLGIWLK